MDSDRIGPYRILQRLGVGGMGEVVLAHDDRLDRLVAIKRLHDGRAAAPHSRERFRREARIAARLNHPAIVQIHDVLHEGEQDYLIMEYVEGHTLRARRGAGPMTVAEVLAIAHQIALGMAVAHDLGVIHRDLKAENILLTRAGRAKITDFGIAKVPGEDTVTADGAVVGTFSAMSPEQALGRTIDQRSDLFSFGILLYEALAGESPFRAETPFLTVQRLVLDEPRPIAELVPSVPEALASLVHQLLAKEPMLRPRHFHEVAAALIELAGSACDGGCHGAGFDGGGEDVDPRPTEDLPAVSSAAADDADEPAPRGARRRWTVTLGAALAGVLGIGYAMHGASSSHPLSPPIRVAVLEPQLSGVAPEVTLLAVAVRDAVMSDLRGRRGVELVPWSDIKDYVDGVTHTTGRPPSQRELRTAVGADEVIATRLECANDSCRVTLERDRVAPESFQLAADTAIRQGATIAVHLSRLYPDHPARGPSGIGAIAPADLPRYLQLVDSYWAATGLWPDELFAELDGIRQRSPRSIDVLVFEAIVLRNRFLQTQDAVYAQRAMELLVAADRRFPDHYDILSTRFDLELAVKQPDAARTSLERLATLDPDSSTTHLQRAKLARARGQLDEARGELDAAMQRDAFSWSVLYYRAQLFQRLGDRVRMRQSLAQLLARSPGNYAGLSLLARDELDAGQLICAEQHFAQLVARKPQYDECLNLGYARSQLGQYLAAADNFRCAAQIRHDDPSSQLNLGEALLLAGDTSAATVQLRALLSLLSHRRDSSGELRAYDRLIEAQALGYLGRSDPALGAEARTRVTALLDPSSSSNVLYTAALVHAVLGDRELATRYVTAYLATGNSAAELSLPWFDFLRTEPLVRDRLATPVIAARCDIVAP